MADIEKSAGEWKATETNKSSSDDVEANVAGAEPTSEHRHASLANPELPPRLARWNAKVENLRAVEARGIARVLPEEKPETTSAKQYIQMFLLWFSINLQATNIIIGTLGPLVFGLGWKDSICIVIFANALAAMGPAIMATYGPESGNRTMIVARYFMGYWPSKIMCICNIIMQIGWGTIGCIVAGQMLSAVNGKGLSIALGCVIAALLIGFISAFGIKWLNRIERYAFIPNAIAILVLIGSAGRNFDTTAKSVGTSAEITAHRATFFALVFAGIIGFSAISADLYVYYPVNTPKWKTAVTTWSGFWAALLISDIVGVGIATGVANVPAWGEASGISSGALLYECYNGLGGFGGLLVVFLALGSVTNNAPCSYAAALDFQVLGRYGLLVPRWAWCLIIMVIELALSVAGRNSLYDVFENFLPIMAYWVCPWLTIAAEEHFIFQRARGRYYDWTQWQNKKHFPLGFAALLAFLIGWAGAIIGMDQIWYVGPVAHKIGNGTGADIGTWLAIGFTGISYPILRTFELKKFGR